MNSNKFRLAAIIHRYFSFLGWFLPDSVLRYRLSVTVVVITSLVGVGFQALTFAAIIFYANLLATGDHLIANLYGLDIDLNPRQSIELLLATSVTSLIFLSLSSLSIYFSRVQNIGIARRYNEYCIQRIMILLERGKQPFHENLGLDQLNDKYILRMVLAESRICGRVLRTLLDMIVPLITLIFALGTLLYLDVAITGIVFLFLLGYLVCQAYISRYGAISTSDFENYRPLVTRKLKEILRRSISANNHRGAKGNSYLIKNLCKQSFRSGVIKKQFDAFDIRIKVTEQSRLLTGFFAALMVCLLFFILGQKIIVSGFGWGGLLVYLVALRFAMTSLQLVFGQITTVNRFYPPVQRYSRFVRAYTAELPNKIPNITLPLTLNIGDPLNIGGDPKLTINTGERIAVVVAFVINKYNYAYLIRQVAELTNFPLNQILANTLFISSNHSLVGYTLRQIFSLEKKDEFSQIDLPDTCLDELRTKIPGLDVHINSTQWEGLDKIIKSLLLLESVISSPEKLILIDFKLIEGIDLDELVLVMGQLNEKVLLIAYENQHSAQIEHFAGNAVLISAGEKVIAGGNRAWYRKQKSVIAEHMPKQSPREVVNSSGEMGTEDDYELG